MLRVTATKEQLVKALGNRRLATINESGCFILDFSNGSNSNSTFQLRNRSFKIGNYYCEQEEFLDSMSKSVHESVARMMTGSKNYNSFHSECFYHFNYYYYFLRFEFNFNPPNYYDDFEYVKVTKRKIDGIEIDFDPVAYRNVNDGDEPDNDMIVFHHFEALSEYNRIMRGE